MKILIFLTGANALLWTPLNWPEEMIETMFLSKIAVAIATGIILFANAKEGIKKVIIKCTHCRTFNKASSGKCKNCNQTLY